jgi:hypothetical protein
VKAPAFADHSGAAADIAFFDWPGFRGVDGVERVLGLYVEAIDVVEPAVPRFGDYRERPPVSSGIGLTVGDTPLNDGVAHHSDAVRIGDHHWTFEEAGLFHPRCASHLAVAVEGPPAGKNRIAHGIFAAWEDCGDTGADWAFADLEFAIAGNESGLTDGNATHVGDGVE